MPSIAERAVRAEPIAGALLAALVALGAAPAVAQSEDAVERGRVLYVEGLAAFEEGRYPEAARAFRAAYELSRVPVALHNMATALRAMERYADALRATRALLEDHPDLDPELRRAAQTLVRELRAEVGVLTLLGVPLEPVPTLRLDGEVTAFGAARPLELELDPGGHRLVLDAPGHAPFDWEGAIEAGERVRLDVDLRPSAGDPLPWVLGVVGAAIVAAIAIGLAVHFVSGTGVAFDQHVEI